MELNIVILIVINYPDTSQYPTTAQPYMQNKALCIPVLININKVRT